MHADATTVRLEKEVCFENEGECGVGNKRILYHKQMKKPRLYVGVL